MPAKKIGTLEGKLGNLAKILSIVVKSGE